MYVQGGEILVEAKVHTARPFRAVVSDHMYIACICIYNGTSVERLSLFEGCLAGYNIHRLLINNQHTCSDGNDHTVSTVSILSESAVLSQCIFNHVR